MKIRAQQITSVEGGQTFCKRIMIAMHKKKVTKQVKAQRSKNIPI